MGLRVVTENDVVAVNVAEEVAQWYAIGRVALPGEMSSVSRMRSRYVEQVISWL